MAAPDLTPLVGCEITQITLDHRVTLLVASEDGGANPSVSAWLAIEAPFVLKSADEAVTMDSPSNSALKSGFGASVPHPDHTLG